jgi:hypothetical protein
MKLRSALPHLITLLFLLALVPAWEARSQDAPKDAAQPTCHDNQKNGDETDVDCGGPKCPKCPMGKACNADTDCAPGACAKNQCDFPPRSTCYDKEKNGQETDVDCGGPKCPRCEDGKACATANDCRSKTCEASVCAAPPKAPTCYDNAKNGLETDVDCGGPKCPSCGTGKQCTTDKDCRSKLCRDSVCKE